MTTIKLATPKSKTNWINFAEIAAAKIGENIIDMVITIAACGMLLAYLFMTQPLAAYEYSGYIIAVHVLILLLRLVHDFDDSWTIEEVGDRVVVLDNKLDELTRRINNDIFTVDELVEKRLEENGRTS